MFEYDFIIAQNQLHSIHFFVQQPVNFIVSVIICMAFSPDIPCILELLSNSRTSSQSSRFLTGSPEAVFHPFLAHEKASVSSPHRARTSDQARTANVCRLIDNNQATSARF